jgi:hypothetical protein
MLHNAEARGKQVSAENIAYYTNFSLGLHYSQGIWQTGRCPSDFN